jgi:hypothetical protein
MVTVVFPEPVDGAVMPKTFNISLMYWKTVYENLALKDSAGLYWGKNSLTDILGNFALI